MDKKEKYYSYVVDDFIKKTEIDHEKKVIKTPFTKPIFFNTNNGYNASNIINYFFFDFYSYAMERYGIHDGVSYGTKPINASATSILATLGDTYLGHGQSGATGSGNINYGEMFVAEGVYSSSKIIEYSNRLTNKWGNFFTKNITNPTEIGTFNNGASVVDNGYSFDGVDDYIDFGVQNYNIDKDETFSISVWFKQTNLSGRKDLFCDIAAIAPFKGWSLRFNRSLLNNNRYYLLLQVGVGNSIQGAIDFAISADTIYNMVFTYDGSSTLVGMLGYINGVNYSLTDTGNTISASISNSNKTTIGSTSPMGGNFIGFRWYCIFC